VVVHHGSRASDPKSFANVQFASHFFLRHIFGGNRGGWIEDTTASC
jgi:hypothetical protein